MFSNTVQEDQVTFTKRKQQASNIIVNALRDLALRIVRAITGNPKDMLIKLDARYDSKSTASKISRMSELVSDRYKSLREDVAKHIDRLSGIIVQLRLMDTNLEDSVAVEILIWSIQVPELASETASIKKISERDLKREDVSARLVEEVADLPNIPGNSFKANAASVHCQICLRTSHPTEKCFLNPINPDSKLQLPNGTVQQILKPSKGKQDKGKKRVR